MALSWIKWMKGLGRRREVLAIAQHLSISRKECAATCAEVWEWADTETRTGKIMGIGVDFIDTIAETVGFGRAMAQVGWLKQLEGGIEFPRWKRHNEKTAKTRAAAAERMAKSRAKNGDKKAQHNRNGTVTKSVTREQKIRISDSDLPAGLKKLAGENWKASLLRNDSRLFELSQDVHRECLPEVSDSSGTVKTVFAVAEHVLQRSQTRGPERVRNPIGLFVSILKKRDWSDITDGQFDAATKRIAEFKRRQPQNGTNAIVSGLAARLDSRQDARG